jgi:hypothetical protein
MADTDFAPVSSCRWPTADGPAGVLDERRPYRVLRDGRIVPDPRRHRAAVLAPPRETRRSTSRPLTVALGAYFGPKLEAIE